MKPYARHSAIVFVATKGIGQATADLLAECGRLRHGRFIPFVAATTQAAFARGVTGTPTVLVNGKPLKDSFGDPQLRSLLQM